METNIGPKVKNLRNYFNSYAKENKKNVYKSKLLTNSPSKSYTRNIDYLANSSKNKKTNNVLNKNSSKRYEFDEV